MSKKHYLSNEDISILCSELASVVSSGLTITDGILVILQDGEDKNKAALLEKILRSIETGSSITRAFDKTEVFPNYFIKMLEVGESTGRLDTVLASLAEYYAGIDEISTSVKSAIAYPSVLLIIVFAVIILLSVYVLPIFSDVFAQLGLTLPDSAQWIMSAGGVISDVAILIIGILAFVIILGVVLYNFVRPFRKAVLRAVSHTKTAKTLYAARFSAALSMTLSSGMDIDDNPKFRTDGVHLVHKVRTPLLPHTHAHVKKMYPHMRKKTYWTAALSLPCPLSTSTLIGLIPWNASLATALPVPNATYCYWELSPYWVPAWDGTCDVPTEEK